MLEEIIKNNHVEVLDCANNGKGGTKIELEVTENNGKHDKKSKKNRQ